MPDPTPSAPTPSKSSDQDIAWLEDVLFTQHGVLSFVSNRRSFAPNDMRWTTLPARGTTRRLVPTASRFAAAAFDNSHDAMSPRRRLVGRVAQASVRIGALRIGPQLRADAHVVFKDPATSVIAAAAEGLGKTVVACAITLGPQRYNRKPVVQLMDDQAKTIGFLKIGADEATSDMVATEANVIERLQRPTSPLLEVPSVLWRSEWQGRSVACFSPVADDGQSVEPADTQRLTDIAAAVVEAGADVREQAVRGSRPVERLRAEAETSDRPDVLDLLRRVETRLGDHLVSLGSWHGDFSPWNMISSASSTALIDWEFADDQMPVGSDLLHHQVMVATHLADEPATAVLRRLLERGNAIPELEAMRVPSRQHRPHLLLYLLELIRRDLELTRLGLSVTGFGRPAAAVVEAILAERNN